MNPYRRRPPRPTPDDSASRARAASYRAARLRLGIVSALIVSTAAAAPLVARWRRPKPAPSVLSIPGELLGATAKFPSTLGELPPSVPLEPLLAADAPDRLALLQPTETALNLRLGESVSVRFNRPMVEGTRVGKPAADPVLAFSPAVHGRGSWTSRSAYEFRPDAATWSETRTVTMTLAATLRSLAGETVAETEPRTVVFDTGPLFVKTEGARRLLPGEPLRLLFSGKVDVHALPSQLLFYEVGGGQRMIPYSLAERPRNAKGLTPVEMIMKRALEPGARISVALAPSLLRGWGSDPRVVDVALAPRPHIEGIGCPTDATEASQCSFEGPPGQVVDIAETLVLLSSEDLGELPSDAVVAKPALDGLAVSVEHKRHLVVRGEWTPGQVYEVRVGALVDKDHHALARTAPLAVRSAGRAPEVHFGHGRLTFEHDAKTVIPLSGVHVEEGEVRIGAVPPGHEIEAMLAPGRWLDAEHASQWARLPLHPLVPTSRPNRWGHGVLDWNAADPSHASMSVVSLLPDGARREADALPTAFIQRTDLGIDAKILARGALVWVTSIATATPVAGARVTVASPDGSQSADASTDAGGLAWIPLAGGLLESGAAVRAVRGDDRAVVLVDPRASIGPRHLGETPGAAPPPEGAWLATVFTDRGICRPGETLHAKATIRAAVQGALAAPTEGSVRLLLFGPSGEAPLAEQTAEISPFGTADASFYIASDSAPGSYRVEVRIEGQDARAGAVSFTVGDYRPPALRVDLEAAAKELSDKDPLTMTIAARYLFGPPAAGLTARWTLLHEPGGEDYPTLLHDYTFGPAGASSRRGTVSTGDVTLDANGRAVVETPVAASAPLREQALFEVSVRDLAGITTTARRRVSTFPATFEVGLRKTPEWLANGTELGVEAVVIAHDGTPRAGREVEARIVREGWHTYWEWSGRGHHEEEEDEDASEGRYQARRAQRSEVVHRCKLTSAETPVRCAFTAKRPGTYLLEATTKDERGRVSVASERVYVAGPDEHPDRDPPGTAITLTPSTRSLDVGDTAQIAFESPFPEAEALLVVEREGMIHSEQRKVSAGGNVFRFPVTAAMVPNAFVSLSLVRPRTGPPGETLDLAAPDLRVGLTELTVHPSAAPLDVKLDTPGPTAPAGSDVPITVTVLDGDDHGVPAEVALYAVDEGTLRITHYTLPDPMDDLFPRMPPAFVWEDLRRSLVSRIPLSLATAAGGDGDSEPHAHGKSRSYETEERYEPTPLWIAKLETDADGRASAVLRLPARPAQYRIMAVAVDAGARAGSAERNVVAAMPIVVRPVLPRFATAGDRFQAAAFVHNTEDQPADVTVTPVVEGLPREPVELHLEPKGDARVAEWIDVPRGDELVVRFDAVSERGSAFAEARVALMPKGRVVRSEAVGAVAGSREIALAIPEGAEALSLTVSPSPFIGFDQSLEALLASPDAGTEPVASSLIGLSAYAVLDTGMRPHSAGIAELRARAAHATARLEALQTAQGGFASFSSREAPDLYLSAYALHALVAARNAGFDVPVRLLDRARGFLGEQARGTGFLDRGDGGHDDLAFALRALTEAGARDDERATALWNQRERLSPYGLAELALAMDPSDRRRDTLVLEAEQQVLAVRDDERTNARVLRWYDGSARTMGAVLEAAVAVDVGRPDAGALASRILAMRSGPDAAWWSPHETSHALAGLAAFAATLTGVPPIGPHVLIDGVPLGPPAPMSAEAWYSLPVERLRGGAHTLRIQVQGTAYFALATRWIAPLGPEDGVARGSEAALHRVLEDATGRPLGPDAHVKLGDLVRVRLFVYSEHATPPYLAVRDRLAGGLEPIDAAHDTSPRESLWALLGMGPDDDVVDVRGHYAARSLGDITHRGFLPSEAVFYLEKSVSGLREITYGVRATAAGTFVLAPAELSALYAPRFSARSTAATLTVDP